jgi:hypothetical protein
MKAETIKKIIDKHLNYWVESELNILPIKVEPAMACINCKGEKWRKWIPIHSCVKEKDIKILEDKIGHSLPEDYLTFLKHKHFYELHIYEANFFEHARSTWLQSQCDNIFNQCHPKYLIEKGYIPFVKWSDWGVLCFDTNANNNDNNYPVVLWENESEHKFHSLYNDFYHFLTAIDKGG